MSHTGSARRTMCAKQDPTGMIGAGLHSDVFQAEEGVAPGAVLMLQEVIHEKCCIMYMRAWSV